VAELLGTSERTVRRWIDGKKLKSHQFGGASRIASADLIVFIERARQGGAPLPARNALEDTFYIVEAIAEILNVCIRTVRRYIKSKALIVHKFGRPIRIAQSDLQDFVDRSRRE
jgi:excisionase family DNA binding protein